MAPNFEVFRPRLENKLSEFHTDADEENDERHSGNDGDDKDDRRNNHQSIFSQDQQKLQYAASLVDWEEPRKKINRTHRTCKDALTNIWNNRFPPELYVLCVLAIKPQEWHGANLTIIFLHITPWWEKQIVPKWFVLYVRTVTDSRLLPKTVQPCIKIGMAPPATQLALTRDRNHSPRRQQI